MSNAEDPEYLQAEPAFANALAAMVDAGVDLIEFNVTAMLVEQEENAHDQFTYVYESPRELSRLVLK